MNSEHESESWLERWWPLLVIVFGATYILVWAMWNPSH